MSTRVHNKIPYKTYISDFFIFGKLTKWRCFVTYLLNKPRIVTLASRFFTDTVLKCYFYLNKKKIMIIDEGTNFMAA